MTLHIALAASLMFEIMSHLSLSSTGHDSSDDYDFSVIPLQLILFIHSMIVYHHSIFHQSILARFIHGYHQ